MNGNKSTNSSIPLFYIIQPVNKDKLIAQNMQEIYRNKERVEEEEIKLEKVKAAVKSEYKEDLQIEETFEENIDSITEEDLQTEETFEENIDSITEEDLQTEEIFEENINSIIEEDLQTEETFKENTDSITEDHLLKGKTSQSEENLNLDENKEVQVERDILKDDLRMKLIRLARYPAVVEKPFCEIKMEGESIIGQIESKRGEFLKIKVGKKIRLIAIDDIDELSII